VRLGREIYDRARPVRSQKPADEPAIGDVALHEDMQRFLGDPGEVFRVTRVRQLVQIDDRLAARREPVEDEIRADESGAAGDEYQLEIRC